MNNMYTPTYVRVESLLRNPSTYLNSYSVSNTENLWYTKSKFIYNVALWKKSSFLFGSTKIFIQFYFKKSTYLLLKKNRGSKN